MSTTMPNMIPSSSSTLSSPEPEVDQVFARQAFESVRAELDALDASELVGITFDVTGAIVTVSGCVPKLAAFRPAFAKLDGFNLATFDKLQTYAYAALYANRKYFAASDEPEPVIALGEELLSIRDLLWSDAEILVKRKLISPDALEKVHGTVGYTNLIDDVGTLCQVFRDHWAAVSSRTSVHEEDLHHAENVVERLVLALGRRKQSPAARSEENDMRLRAVTVLAHAFEEVRRALTFLRWHEGDADVIAPSLYKKGRRGKDAVEEDNAAPNALAPAPEPAPAPAPKAIIASGMPGEDPIVR